MMKAILFFLVLLFLIVPVNAVDWHDDSRLKRVQLNVNNSSVELTDYQLIKNITYDNDMQSDFDDLLFYNESGGTVSYWIESKTDSSTADVWLKVPLISTTTGAKVWMYYGNPDASSASSISDTFIFGDDFEYSDNPTNHGWTLVSGTYNSNYVTSTDYAKRGSKSLKLYPGNSQTVTLKKIFSVTNKIAIEADYYETDAAENTIYTGLQINKITNGIIDGIPWCYNNANYKGTANNGIITSSIARANGWHKYTNQRDGINAKSFVDDVELTQAAYASSQTVLEAGLNSGSSTSGWGSTRYYDSFRIRKYNTPGLTWGADGEEESYEAPLQGTFLYPNSTYSIGYYGSLTSELVYGTGINFSDLYTFNLLSSGNMEYLSIDDTNYIPSIDKDAAHDGYMYGNFSLPCVESINFITVKTVHNRVHTNPVILGLFNVSTQKWHAVNNSSVETIDIELTYNITGTDIQKYTTLTDNTLNLSVSLNTNGDGNYDVFVDYVEVYVDYEEVPCLTLEYVHNLTIINKNDILILRNDVEDLERDMINLYLFVLLCTVFLVATLRKRGDQ